MSRSWIQQTNRYYRDTGMQGWAGGSDGTKVMVFEVDMPHCGESGFSECTHNRPAVWALNAKVISKPKPRGCAVVCFLEITIVRKCEWDPKLPDDTTVKIDKRTPRSDSCRKQQQCCPLWRPLDNCCGSFEKHTCRRYRQCSRSRFAHDVLRCIFALFVFSLLSSRDNFLGLSCREQNKERWSAVVLTQSTCTRQRLVSL